MFSANKITIIGVGLIGGSLALALKKNARIGEIVGISRTRETLDKALALKVIDRASQDIAQEVSDSDIVVVAVPVLATEHIFKEIASADYADTIVTDVGSVKGCIMESGQRHFGADFLKFVPAHPIAGTEHSGVAAAFAELYVNRHTIIVPDQTADPEAVNAVQAMWESVGSDVKFMDAEEHDAVLSAASHLPHLLAFSLVHFIDNLPTGQRCFEFAAGGFYDFTRIASSDAVMWRDICSANSNQIASHLDKYIDHLAKLRSWVAHGETESLHEVFSNARRARNEWIAKKPGV